MIYESRPNVTIDAGSLALKSGNVVILRGGKEAINSNLALGKILSEAVKKAGLPKDAVQIIDTPDRELATALMKQNKNIDVVIPRGGKGLISTVYRESLIPVIAHLDGICHLYVDESADINMAADIAVNAKAQRPGVCNAIETLLVHKKAAAKFLPVGLKALRKAKVKLKCCNATKKYAKGIKVEQATEEDWATEYLDYILSVKIVSDINDAIRHINHYGSHHTDAIITGCVNAAEKFRSGIDSSSVMVNASTRFSDGFEYGLGAEMGISTNKLHARGPVGLEELTTYKFLVDGNGQIRT
jgi:glutamate-5-semialdehyde dehydrogenase